MTGFRVTGHVKKYLLRLGSLSQTTQYVFSRRSSTFLWLPSTDGSWERVVPKIVIDESREIGLETSVKLVLYPNVGCLPLNKKGGR